MWPGRKFRQVGIGPIDGEPHDLRPMPTPSRATEELIERILAAIPAPAIGEIYCDEGGEEFFEAMRPRILDDGRAWCAALASRLERGDGQKSLYVGAGIAELPALLAEALDLGRSLVVTNLRTEECELLNRVLVRHGVKRQQLEFCDLDAKVAVESGPFSHVSMVSVLTDPDSFPQASGLAYGTLPPVLLDTKAFERERGSIRSLLDALLGALTVPGAWVTTTAEETPWLLERAAASGLALAPDDEMLNTAVVGDPIGFLKLTQKDQ